MKKIIFFILICHMFNVFSQTNLHLMTREMQTILEPDIVKKIKKYYGKEAVKEYKNILLIPFFDIRGLNYSSIDFDSIDNETISALKKNDIVNDLEIQKRSYYEVLIYNDSLDILGIYNHNIYDPSDVHKKLLEYYLILKPDFLFFTQAGSFDYFVLIDNKVYKLEYDSNKKEFTRVKL